jgi:hypothetical protein
LILFRGNKLVNAILRLEEHSTETYRIEKTENPTELQKDIYEKWLETNFQ